MTIWEIFLIPKARAKDREHSCWNFGCTTCLKMKVLLLWNTGIGTSFCWTNELHWLRGLQLMGRVGTILGWSRWMIRNDITNWRLCVDKFNIDLSYVYPIKTHKVQKINISIWRNQAKMYDKHSYKQDGILNFCQRK